MLWLLLACNGEKTPETCSLFSSLTHDGQHFSLPEESCSQISISPRIIGEGDLTIRFEEIENGWQPIITAQTEATFQALSLEGSYSLSGTTPTRLWKQGYQSWWWSGITDLEEVELDASTNLPLVGGDGDGTSATEEKAYSSWWNALIGKDQGASFIVGALASTKTRFWAAFSESNMWVVWGGRDEQIKLSAREELRLDPFWMATSPSPFTLHREYASQAANYHDLSPRTDLPPVGWATWYTYYEDISEEIIVANLEKAKELAGDRNLEPMTVFQIDDGWQRHWGEWEANEDFPSGMEALAQQIQQAGFTPGLWIAPFYVSVEAAIYQEHDDWWVLDESGEPIRFANLGSGDYVIIDATHPDAGGWMRDQIATKIAQGWTYLKLDFLFAGAQAGTRFTDVTATEAYHVGMAYIMEAVGENFFLACGAPMLPTLGYADAFRTGADIGFGFDPGPRREYLQWQLRSTAARSWQNQLWWWVDPDQILLREPFSMEELTGAVAANIVSGGSWLIGDDLTTVQNDRLQFGLNKNTVQFRGFISEPIRPLQQASTIDLGPVSALTADIYPPIEFQLSSGHTVYINLGDSPVKIKGISGTEFFSGANANGEERTLTAGQAEIWIDN